MESQSALEAVSVWINAPLFHIGQTPVTLGGLGTAVIVVLGSLAFSNFIQRLIAARLTQRPGFHQGLTYAIQRGLHYLVLCLGIVLAAQCVGLNLGSLTVVFGFLGVGIGFGLQNITSNFISGIILLVERPISVGDLISVEGQRGTVSQIQMRATIINTKDNVSIIVPNSAFLEHPVINWSHGDTRVRIHSPVGVAYGSDVQLVSDTLLSVAKNHPAVLKNPVPEVRFLSFGDSSLNFELLSWLGEPSNQSIVLSDLNYAIDAEFRKAGISIPFPQRDVHFKTPVELQRI